MPGKNGQNGHVPKNRISQHLPKGTNGHANRLKVFSEDAVPEETHEPQLT